MGKLNLKVKRAQFKEMGKTGAVVATRTVAWLCVVPQEDGSPSCLALDEDYQRPLFATSPGMIGTRLEEDLGA